MLLGQPLETRLGEQQPATKHKGEQRIGLGDGIARPPTACLRDLERLPQCGFDALVELVHADLQPLVSGAAIRFDGQIAVFDARDPANPCYHCLFGEGDEFEETRCATMGVFAPLVGIVGATQAAEALKLLAPAGRSLAGRLLLIDALTMEWRELTVVKDPACPVCGMAAR